MQAVRAGPWKLYLPLALKTGLGVRRGKPQSQPLALYDVRADVSEEREFSAGHPDVVAALLAKAERARAELGDGDRPGLGQRRPGHVAQPVPLVRRRSADAP